MKSTVNVTLRKFQDGDFGAFMKCHGPEGLGTIVPPEEATFRKFFELYRQDANHWAVDAEGDWAGHIGFKNPRNEGVAEVGYNIASAFQRRGIATAALGQLTSLAFQNRVLKLWARTTVLNMPSIKLLERMGFRKEGHLRNQRAVQGKLVDEVYYGLTLEDFRARGLDGSEARGEKGGIS